MPVIPRRSQVWTMFQSAPGREAGRCTALHLAYFYTTVFQSAPGREAGRCPVVAARLAHAPSFNPRPAVRPGDAPDDVLEA